MIVCAHCGHSIPADAPHCGNCGQSRILDSLLTPRPRPSWQVHLWNGLTIAALLLFGVSASVAFLREAKVVRVARDALLAGEPTLTQWAGEILSPFLERRPDHEEARYLAAVAAARMEEVEKVVEHRDHLAGLAPDRLAELDAEIGVAIDASITSRGCGAAELLGYYDATGILGDEFQPRILTNLQSAVRRCQRTRNELAAYALLVGLIERGASDQLVEQTYLHPLQQAVAAGRYDEAWSLAQGASRISVETRAAVDERLADVRDRVDISIQSVEQACRELRAAAESRVGSSWCFSRSIPAAVRSRQDGWGRALRYKPLQLAEDLQCYQGFEVVSLGSDGRATAEPRGHPDADLLCRFSNGREERQIPDPFWRSR